MVRLPYSTSKMKMHRSTAIVIFIACFASLSCGLVIGASNIPIEGQDLCWEFLKFYDPNQASCSPVNNSVWNFLLITSFCISAFISSLFAGTAISKFGRKDTLLYNNFFFFLGGMVTCLAPSPEIFCIGRIFSGIACGIAFVTVPVYITEVSHSRSDGLLTTFHQASVALGILISSLLSIYGSAPPSWRLTYGFVVIPATIQSFLIYSLCVETPCYLISINEPAKAEEALRILRDTNAINMEFSELERLQRNSTEVEQKEQTVPEIKPESNSVQEEKQRPRPRPRPLIIACSAPTETIAERIASTEEATKASDTAPVDAIRPSQTSEADNCQESSNQAQPLEEGSSKQQVSAEVDSSGDELSKQEVPTTDKPITIGGSLSLSSSSSIVSSAAVATVKSLPTLAPTDEKTEVEGETSNASGTGLSAPNQPTSTPSSSQLSISNASLEIEQAPPIEQDLTVEDTSVVPSTTADVVDIEARAQEHIKYYETMSFRSLFTNGEYLRNRVIAVIYISILQQFFGISAVVYFYPTRILSFYDTGAGSDYAVGITVCYFYSIILAIFLLDHVSNYRNLMLASGIGILLFSILFTIGSATSTPLLSLVSIYFYIISFTMGICMMPTIILGRGIPTHAIASTSSLSTSLAWLVHILIAQCFPLLLSSIHGYVFLIFGFFTIGLVPFIYYVFIVGLD